MSINEYDLQRIYQELRDLVEYLERKNIISCGDNSWNKELIEMRRQERKNKEIQNAIGVLESNGYFIVKNKNDLDAARVKLWTKGNDQSSI